MTCRHCGAALQNPGKFCAHCGGLTAGEVTALDLPRLAERPNPWPWAGAALAAILLVLGAIGMVSVRGMPRRTTTPSVGTAMPASPIASGPAPSHAGTVVQGAPSYALPPSVHRITPLATPQSGAPPTLPRLPLPSAQRPPDLPPILLAQARPASPLPLPPLPAAPAASAPSPPVAAQPSEPAEPEPAPEPPPAPAPDPAPRPNPPPAAWIGPRGPGGVPVLLPPPVRRPFWGVPGTPYFGYGGGFAFGGPIAPYPGGYGMWGGGAVVVGPGTYIYPNPFYAGGYAPVYGW